MRKITGIIIHCTATRPAFMEGHSTAAKVAEIRRWHVDPKPRGNGWSDIGYHFLIDRNGAVAKGRPIERDGAHVRGHNKGTIGISLFGGHGSAETDSFGVNFTGEQAAALRKLVNDLRAKYGMVPITGHNEYAAKACPGFNVQTWLKVAVPDSPIPPLTLSTPPTPPAVTPDRPKGLWGFLWALLTRKD